jgi:hypothetical protein
MSDFDFIQAFSGVDVLAVEAIGTVVGKAVAATYRGMVDAGMSEHDAHQIVRAVLHELFTSFKP